MQNYHILKEIDIKDTFKNEVLKGIFDINMQKIKIDKIHTLDFDIMNFNIGVIYGSSGSGKTLLGQEISKKLNIPLVNQNEWNNDSLISNFNCEVNKAVNFLSSIGLNTQVSYLKPYHILSNGEKFRADLALSIFKYDYVIIDEYTSFVDRQIAKICSLSVKKIIKKYNKKVIFISCHSDFLDYLEPDWTYNLDKSEFKKDLLWQREKLQFHITRGNKEEWRNFKEFHYLSSNLHVASECFFLWCNNNIIGFIAFIFFPVKNGRWKKVHRIVIKPDYQGLGLANIFLTYCCEIVAKKHNCNIGITTSLKNFAYSINKNEKFICINNGNYRNSITYKRELLKTAKVKYFSFKYKG